MSSRVAVGIASGTAVPTTPETVIAVLAPGSVNPGSLAVYVRAEVVLTGATSVTAMTVKLRRGATASGTLLNTLVQPVNGAVSQDGGIGFLDASYDGTGYCLTAQATGAAGTCGAGVLEAQVTPTPETF